MNTADYRRTVETLPLWWSDDYAEWRPLSDPLADWMLPHVEAVLAEWLGSLLERPAMVAALHRNIDGAVPVSPAGIRAVLDALHDYLAPPRA